MQHRDMNQSQVTDPRDQNKLANEVKASQHGFFSPRANKLAINAVAAAAAAALVAVTAMPQS